MTAPDGLGVRPLGPDEPVAPLTALLHRAYASLAALGLNYTAVDQADDVTARRARRGLCLLAELDGRLVGTISGHRGGPEGAHPWERRPDAFVLEQLAVEPGLQRGGIGAALLDAAEAYAKAAGATVAVGDTAAPAGHLVAYYGARGYRVVDTVQWPGKVYRSVVLAKDLR